MVTPNPTPIHKASGLKEAVCIAVNYNGPTVFICVEDEKQNGLIWASWEPDMPTALKRIVQENELLKKKLPVKLYEPAQKYVHDAFLIVALATMLDTHKMLKSDFDIVASSKRIFQDER